MKRCPRVALPILLWWFMTASTLPYGAAVVTTHGPFATVTDCQQSAAWAKAMTSNPKIHPVTVSSCWSDGR